MHILTKTLFFLLTFLTLVTAQEKWELAFSLNGYEHKLSPDGSKILTSDNNYNIIYNTADGSEVFKVNGAFKQVNEISQNNNYYLTGNEFLDLLFMYDLNTGEKLWEKNLSYEIKLVKFSPNSDKIAIGNYDEITIYDTKTSDSLWTVKFNQQIYDFTFNTTGTILAVCYGTTLVNYDFNFRIENWSVEMKHSYSSIKFSNNDNIIILSGSYAGFYDALNGDLLTSVFGWKCTGMDAEEDIAILSNEYASLSAYEMETDNQLWNKTGYQPKILRDSNKVVFRNSNINLVDLKTGDTEIKFDTSVSALDISSDEKRAITYDDSKIKIWDIYKGQLLWSKEYDIYYLDGGMKFLPDNKSFLVQSKSSEKIEIWKKTKSISLSYPVGKESLTVGSLVEIKWTADQISKIKIELSTDNGITYEEIANNVDSGLGKFIWTIPEKISNECIIKISDIDDLSISYISKIFSIVLTTSIDDKLPLNYELKQNYPNPFNPSTNISFSIPETTDVELEVFNTAGEKVYKKVFENLTIGRYEHLISLSGCASGIYYYRIRTETFSDTKKMLLLK